MELKAFRLVALISFMNGKFYDKSFFFSKFEFELNALLFFKAVIVSSLTPKEVEQEIETGNRLLATGQLADALMHYHNAIGN